MLFSKRSVFPFIFKNIGTGMLIIFLLFATGLVEARLHPHYQPVHSKPVHSSAAWTVPILRENYLAWKEKYIEPNGMVYAVDWSNRQDKETGRYVRHAAISEGQSYAMFMSLLMNDKPTFNKVWRWTQAHMQRPDHLFNWWVSTNPDSHEITPVKTRIATDGDILIAHSLLAAGRQWHNPAYVSKAKQIIAALWNNTVVHAHGRYYVASEIVRSTDPKVVIDSAYLMPYAFRAFSTADPGHAWKKLASDSYLTLATAAALHRNGLPPDWCLLDTRTGRLSLTRKAAFSSDSRRVFWHVSYDASLGNKQAKQFLKKHAYLVHFLKNGHGYLPTYIKPNGENNGNQDFLPSASMPALAQMNVLEPHSVRKYYRDLDSRHTFWEMPGSYYNPAVTWFSMYTIADKPCRKELARHL